MEIAKIDGYDHLISKSGNIDLITSIEIDLLDYINGYEKEILYVDGSMMNISVPPFQTKFIELSKKGLKGGTFLINISIKIIEKDAWEALSESDKASMIRILESLYKTI